MLNALLFIMATWVQPVFAIKSPAFAPGHYIQMKYTCMGENMNPPFVFEGMPRGTKTLALIIEDQDTSLGPFDHWVVWNIPPTGRIAENSSPGVSGLNSDKQNKYTGPCPPNGMHEYHFKAYALNSALNLPTSTGKQGLLKAMEGHVLASAEFTAQFAKAMNRIDK